MRHFLMKDNVKEVEYLNDSMFIQGGNALFHSFFGLAPTVAGITTDFESNGSKTKSNIFYQLIL